MHLFLDDKIISEFPESSKQCFAFLSIYSNMISKTRFFGIRASQDAIVEITWTFWKKWCFMDLLWLTSPDWQLFAAHNWLRLLTVSHYVNSSVKFDIRFTNDSANLAYVEDLFRMVFINAVTSTTVAYFWRDCDPSLVWPSRSSSDISLNLRFTVCRQVPSSL